MKCQSSSNLTQRLFLVLTIIWTTSIKSDSATVSISLPWPESPNLHFTPSLYSEGWYSKSKRLFDISTWITRSTKDNYISHIQNQSYIISQPWSSSVTISVNAVTVHPRTSHKPSKHPRQLHLRHLPYLTHLQVLLFCLPKLSETGLLLSVSTKSLTHSVTGSLLWPGTVLSMGEMEQMKQTTQYKGVYNSEEGTDNK